MTYVSTASLPVKPRWTPQQAVLYGLGEVTHPDMWYAGRCDNFCAWCYGYAGSGYYSAIAHWRAIPNEFRHRNASAPSGALVFWNIGIYGHVSLCVGPNLVASNDVKRAGKIDVVSIDYISQIWGAQLLGWTEPYLNAAWGVNPNPAPQVPIPPQPQPDLDDIGESDMIMVKAPDGHAYLVMEGHIFEADGATANNVSVPLRGSVPYFQATPGVWNNIVAAFGPVHYLPK